MAQKEFAKTTKEITAVLKKLSTEVPESSNAAEYSKFLQKTLITAQTFEKGAPTYVDYVARGMKPKAKKLEPDTTKKETTTKKKDAADGGGGGDAKKRKADTPVQEEKAKVTKKAKAD